jgi:hypothetical protein
MTKLHGIDPDAIEWPQSIRGINRLERPVKEAIYHTLILHDALEQFGVDPHSDLVHINAPSDTRSVEIAVFHTHDADDPMMYLHMADTMNYQIVVLLLRINDPASPRFNVDVDENGRPTHFGTARRNISEELRAMEFGLAPGQVRRGMRISRDAISIFEAFVINMKHELVMIEPLFYHTAILFERYGFSYVAGRKRMEWINEAFQPGGDACLMLDGSTPFRHPEAAHTVRGRSWAIHDGVLGEPFGDLRMSKRVRRHAGISTFPDAAW